MRQLTERGLRGVEIGGTDVGVGMDSHKGKGRGRDMDMGMGMRSLTGSYTGSLLRV